MDGIRISSSSSSSSSSLLLLRLRWRLLTTLHNGTSVVMDENTPSSVLLEWRWRCRSSRLLLLLALPAAKLRFVDGSTKVAYTKVIASSTCRNCSANIVMFYIFSRRTNRLLIFVGCVTTSNFEMDESACDVWYEYVIGVVPVLSYDNSASQVKSP